ncbi:MAG: hypothetical protein HYT62_00650 [Candidatus Yanofskybacteria bacterium]|nr:hypothetical protein [Candidatus Yanofskybacteria bacterium]
MEKFERNRLIEDANFYDRILGQILDELESLSKTFDDQMAELGYERSWLEKINKIKTGEKLGAEPEVRRITLEIAQKSGLSDIELTYLLNLIFKPPKYRKQETDDD